jgi:hypothetical protein
MLGGLQKQWGFDDFLADGAAISRHPLVPVNLKSYLETCILAWSPELTVVSDTVYPNAHAISTAFRNITETFQNMSLGG